MSERSKLLWRCRRGMKEMDLVLLAYLDKHYDQADAIEKQAFIDILELQDPDLFAYLIGRQSPADPAHQHVLEKIRTSFSA